jgi:hypothetical protein
MALTNPSTTSRRPANPSCATRPLSCHASSPCSAGSKVSRANRAWASHGLAHGASPGERASGRAESELMMGLRYITHYTVFLPQPMIVKGTHSQETHTTRSAPLAPHRIRCDRARLSDLARLHASVTSCLDAPALTVDAAHGSLQKDSLSLSTRLPPRSHLTLPVEPQHEPQALLACAQTASNPPRMSLPCGA